MRAVSDFPFTLKLVHLRLPSVTADSAVNRASRSRSTVQKELRCMSSHSPSHSPSHTHLIIRSRPFQLPSWTHRVRIVPSSLIHHIVLGISFPTPITHSPTLLPLSLSLFSPTDGSHKTPLQPLHTRSTMILLGSNLGNTTTTFSSSLTTTIK